MPSHFSDPNPPSQEARYRCRLGAISAVITAIGSEHFFHALLEALRRVADFSRADVGLLTQVPAFPCDAPARHETSLASLEFCAAPAMASGTPSQVGAPPALAFCLDLESGFQVSFRLCRNPLEAEFLSWEREDVAEMAPVIAKAIERHFALHARATPTHDAQALVLSHLRATMEGFGSSYLSQREMTVLTHMLRGYSSSGTANRLGITEETVKFHRKNIHRKLDVRSQGELFSLFINCLPYIATGGAADPLATYQGRPAKPAANSWSKLRDPMPLGHWHLTQPPQTAAPMERAA